LIASLKPHPGLEYTKDAVTFSSHLVLMNAKIKYFPVKTSALEAKISRYPFHPDLIEILFEFTRHTEQDDDARSTCLLVSEDQHHQRPAFGKKPKLKPNLVIAGGWLSRIRWMHLYYGD
jgi:hypothetical protein